MNEQEYLERLAVLHKENIAIGEENRQLIAKNAELEKWMNKNSPDKTSLWQLIVFEVKSRFWFDPQLKEIAEKGKELRERQDAVIASLELLQSGETPTLH